MRVLFTVNPDKAVFLPMVPLAWALRTAGHEVRVASQPRFADVITQAGLTAVPVGRDSDHFFRLARLTPGLLETAGAGLPPPWNVVDDPAAADWDAMRQAHAEAVQIAHKPDNFPIIAGLVEFARSWRPDLVVWEPLTYAGAIAAKACGAAHARLLWSIDVFGVTREHHRRLAAGREPAPGDDPLADWLASYGERYGYEFSEDMVTGQVTVDQLPASLSRTASLPYLPMGYVPYGGPAVVPRWLWEPVGRPRVAVTLGITATDLFAGYPMRLADLLDALADLAVDVVATVAKAEQARLTRIPDNVRVVSYVPLHALAPTCAVVVNHAGPGTVLTTARYAVPQLTVPSDFDAPQLASRLTTQGAGLHLSPAEATPDAVRDRVCRLLDEPGFRDRAAELRDEIAAMPTPNQLVGPLETFTSGHHL